MFFADRCPPVFFQFAVAVKTNRTRTVHRPCVRCLNCTHPMALSGQGDRCPGRLPAAPGALSDEGSRYFVRHCREGRAADRLSRADKPIGEKNHEGAVYPAFFCDGFGGAVARASCRAEKNAAKILLTIGAASPCLSKLLRNGMASVARNCSRMSSCMSSSSR
jgi:hypothetical protein